jgi:hypothetical protein
MGNALRQYSRRIVFYDPTLFVKSLGKVTFEDLIMDDDFEVEDIIRFVILLRKRLLIGLRWWKDSLIEAIAMVDSPMGNTASSNLGNIGV